MASTIVTILTLTHIMHCHCISTFAQFITSQEPITYKLSRTTKEACIVEWKDLPSADLEKLSTWCTDLGQESCKITGRITHED